MSLAAGGLVLGPVGACAQPSDVAVGSGGCPACQGLRDGGSHRPPGGGTGDAGGGSGDAGSSDDGGGGDAGGCPAGSVIFSGQTLDLCKGLNDAGQGVPLEGVTVGTLSPWGSSVVSGDGGDYALCVPSGQPFTATYTRSDYVSVFLGELTLTQDTTAVGRSGGIFLLCQPAFSLYATSVPFDPSQAMVLAQVVSASNAPPCGGWTADGGWAEQGWTIWATLPDGGPSVGQVIYVDPSGALDAISGTTWIGEALVYDIPADAGWVEVHASKPSLDASCHSTDSSIGFDGLVHVAGGTFGYYPWGVP